MTPLVGRGWVRSEPGPTGGYVLSVDPDEITVLEVIEAVEGPTDTTRCVMEGRDCLEGAPCALHDSWSRAREQLLAELAATSFASVATKGVRP